MDGGKWDRVFSLGVGKFVHNFDYRVGGGIIRVSWGQLLVFNKTYNY